MRRTCQPFFHARCFFDSASIYWHGFEGSGEQNEKLQLGTDENPATVELD
jgi:hypothetical protein